MAVVCTVEFKQQDTFLVKFAGLSSHILIDKRKEGYDALGPNPLELFLASLGGCVAVYTKRFLEGMRLEFKTIKVEATADFVAKDLQMKNLRVFIHTDAAVEDKKDALLRFVHNCPIHNTVVNTQHIDISLGSRI